MTITQEKKQLGAMMRAVENDEAFYNEMIVKLKEIANDIGDYINSNDMIDEVDEKAVNGMMGILNDL